MDDNYQFDDRSRETEICIDFPERLSAVGPDEIQTYIMPMVLLQVILIFFIHLFSHTLLKRLGFTKITSEILAGMVVTPTVLGSISTKIFTSPSEQVFAVATKFNYILFLFLLGVRTDVNVVRKTGKSAILSGLLGLLIPLFVGLAVVSELGDKYDLNPRMVLALINVTFVYAGTPFAGVLYLVTELEIMNSELGWQAMSVGVAGDMFSIWTFFISYTINVSSKTKMLLPSIVSLGGVLVYVGVLVFIVKPYIRWVILNTPEGSMVGNKYVFAILAFAGISSIFFYSIGQAVVIAPYFLGLTVPAGPPFGTTLEAKLNTMVSHLFMPLYVSSIAMKIDLSQVNVDNPLMESVAIVLAVTSTVKFITYLISAWFFKLPFRDCFALAFICCNRGLIELSCFNLQYELRIINVGIFSMTCSVVFVTLSVLPMIVRFLYDPSTKYAGYKVRTILALPPKSELLILACIYRSEDITPIVTVLDSAAPNKDWSLNVHALHVLKLEGQFHSMFITHGLDKNNLSNYRRSKEVIFSFKKLARSNPGITGLSAYTSLSLPQAMHEDICMLALSKLASFIILPFHITWNIEGQINQDDKALRNLNSSIMQRAPCSVGIMVDKGTLVRRRYHRDASLPSGFNVAVLFFGGKDDREGLALAKRMARNALVQLTVICFNCERSAGDGDDMSWERMLDMEQLNAVKNGYLDDQGGYVTYVEETVRDGLHTVERIRDVIRPHNLIIAGRRYKQETKQTAGLEEWSEFPELGVVGDLLVSSDFADDISVLVVQQQIQASSSTGGDK